MTAPPPAAAPLRCADPLPLLLRDAAAGVRPPVWLAAGTQQGEVLQFNSLLVFYSFVNICAKICPIFTMYGKY